MARYFGFDTPGDAHKFSFTEIGNYKVDNGPTGLLVTGPGSGIFVNGKGIANNFGRGWTVNTVGDNLEFVGPGAVKVPQFEAPGLEVSGSWAICSKIRIKPPQGKSHDIVPVGNNLEVNGSGKFIVCEPVTVQGKTNSVGNKSEFTIKVNQNNLQIDGPGILETPGLSIEGTKIRSQGGYLDLDGSDVKLGTITLANKSKISDTAKGLVAIKKIQTDYLWSPEIVIGKATLKSSALDISVSPGSTFKLNSLKVAGWTASETPAGDLVFTGTGSVSLKSLKINQWTIATTATVHNLKFTGPESSLVTTKWLAADTVDVTPGWRLQVNQGSLDIMCNTSGKYITNKNVNIGALSIKSTLEISTWLISVIANALNISGGTKLNLSTVNSTFKSVTTVGGNIYFGDRGDTSLRYYYDPSSIVVVNPTSGRVKQGTYIEAFAFRADSYVRRAGVNL